MILSQLNFIFVLKSILKKLIVFLALILFSFSGFSQSRYIPVAIKKIVFSRDGGACQCCGGSQSLEYDHVTPFSCGGSSTDASNIQLLCLKCNRSKSNSCTCKVHNRRVGTNCCDNATNKSSSSSASSSPSRQCSGTTQKGSRCKKNTKSSSGRCHLH